MKLMMKESFEDVTKGYLLGETHWYEPYTDNRGRLFRSLQREYGRCTSRVYVDTPSGTKTVGWYFERKEEYEDSGRYGRPAEYYVRGVWVQIAEVEEEESDDC